MEEAVCREQPWLPRWRRQGVKADPRCVFCYFRNPKCFMPGWHSAWVRHGVCWGGGGGKSVEGEEGVTEHLGKL